jgi:hypothetical protein
VQSNVLTCWKDVAEYLNKGVRTVQRLESRGLPIRRPADLAHKCSIIAYPSELDAWMEAHFPHSSSWKQNMPKSGVSGLETGSAGLEEVRIGREALTKEETRALPPRAQAYIEHLEREVARLNASTEIKGTRPKLPPAGLTLVGPRTPRNSSRGTSENEVPAHGRTREG